jgi:hypothetical protein
MVSKWFETAFGYRVFGPGVINTRSAFPVHSHKVGCDIPDFSLRFFYAWLRQAAARIFMAMSMNRVYRIFQPRNWMRAISCWRGGTGSDHWTWIPRNPETGSYQIA